MKAQAGLLLMFRSSAMQARAMMVATEAAFLVAYLAFVYIRMLYPDMWHFITGGEKTMDFSFLNAIVRSNERAFMLAKQKSRGKIEAAYALMMCFGRANVRQKPRSPLVVL